MASLLPLVYHREAAARAAREFTASGHQTQTDLELIKAVVFGGALYDAVHNIALHNAVSGYTDINGIYEFLVDNAYVSCHDVTHHFHHTDNNFYEARLGDIVLFRNNGSPMSSMIVEADRVGVITSFPAGRNFYPNLSSVGFPNYGITRQPNNKGWLQEAYPDVRVYVMSFRV